MKRVNGSMNYQDQDHRPRRPNYPTIAGYQDSPYEDPAGYQGEAGYSGEYPGYSGAAARYSQGYGQSDGSWNGSQGGYRDRADDFHVVPGYSDRRGTYQPGYQDTMTLQARPASASGWTHDDASGSPHDDGASAGGVGLLAGAIAGVAAVAVTLGVATLVAGFMGSATSPVTAMGVIYILSFPAGLRESAGRLLGPDTQPVMLIGLYLLLEIVAVVTGAIARRRKALGALGIAALGVVAAGAVLIRPGSHPTYAIPSAVGALAGIAVLVYLVRAPLRYQAPASPGPESLRYQAPAFPRPESLRYQAPAFPRPERR